MSNKYNSKLDTFTGLDMYNLAMPVTPPADLPLTSTLFTPRYLADRQSSGGVLGQVFGMAVTEKPYLRSFGIFSNMADGLVDANTSHPKLTKGQLLNMRLDQLGAALTGTISNTAGNAAVVGVGTLFTEELCVGMNIVWPDAGGNVRIGAVAMITDDLNLTLSVATSTLAASMFAGVNTAGSTAYPLVLSGSSLTLACPTLNTLFPADFFISDVSKILALTGSFTVTAASAAVVGVGTSFTTQVAAGQIIRYVETATGLMRTVKVLSVQSDLALTLTTVALYTGTWSSAKASQTAIVPAQLTSFLGVLVQIVSDNTWYTISIDPAYAGKQLMFHAVCNIEHTSDLSQSW